MADTVKERLVRFIKSKHLSVKAFENSIGVSNAYVSSIRKGISSDKVALIKKVYPELNIDWLLYGEGEMLKKQESPQPTAANYRLVPMYTPDAETITSHVPFKDAADGDICISVLSNAMSPTIKAGATALLRQIDNWSQFLEFGQIYFIKLNDGRCLIRELRNSQKNDAFRCVSHNSTFDAIDLPKSLINCVYIVKSIYAIIAS